MWCDFYVESNGQTEQTGKTETDVQIERRIIAIGDGEVREQRIEQKGKRTHELGQQFGDCMEKRSTRGLNDNGKCNKNFKRIFRQLYIHVTIQSENPTILQCSYKLSVPG